MKIESWNICYEAFKNNSTMAIYLLTGDYLFKFFFPTCFGFGFFIYFFLILSSGRYFGLSKNAGMIDQTTLPLLTLQLVEKNQQNIEFSRKLLKSAKSWKPSSVKHSTILSTPTDIILEKVPYSSLSYLFPSSFLSSSLFLFPAY